MSCVRLFFAGDFCSKPTTEYISVSEDLLKLMQSCDYKVVNFEVPLKPDNPSGLPCIGSSERFFQNDDAPGFLRRLGFNLFSMANNHAFDWGDAGFEKTKASLGDDYFGSGTYDEAYKVKIVEVRGVKIGFLALTYSSYFGSFNDVLNREGLACACIDDLKVNHVIIEAKKNVDFLFILPHDGIEYVDIPLPETIARYRDFVDYGADGVIASHPHCPQGWEVYKGKPVFYSMGNFFFNSKDDTLYRAWNRPHWYEGICVVLEICDGKVNFSVVNTKNTDNVSLSIDVNPEREKYNKVLCCYLSDDDLYNKRLQLILEKGKSEMAVVENAVHKQKLGTFLKICMKKLVKMYKRSDKENTMSLVSLMKNETRKNLLLRSIQK